jgi:hypothetical protein
LAFFAQVDSVLFAIPSFSPAAVGPNLTVSSIAFLFCSDVYRFPLVTDITDLLRDGVTSDRSVRSFYAAAGWSVCDNGS